MKLKVNGKEIDLDENFNKITIVYLLEYLKIKPDAVVAEKNGIIVDRYNYNTEELFEGDVLEIVQFVGGG